MSTDRYASPKMRTEDYEVIQNVTREFPVNAIDVFAAQRICWQNTPEKKRMDYLKLAAQGRKPRGRPSRHARVEP